MRLWCFALAVELLWNRGSGAGDFKNVVPGAKNNIFGEPPPREEDTLGPGQRYERWLEKTRQKARASTYVAIAPGCAKTNSAQACADSFSDMVRDRAIIETFIGKDRLNTSPFVFRELEALKKVKHNWEPVELKKWFIRSRGLGEVSAAKATQGKATTIFLKATWPKIPGTKLRYLQVPSWATSAAPKNVSSDDFLVAMDGLEEWKRRYVVTLEPDLLAQYTKKLAKALEWWGEVARSSAHFPEAGGGPADVKVRVHMQTAGTNYIMGPSSSPRFFRQLRGRTRWSVFRPESYWEYYPHPVSSEHRGITQFPWHDSSAAKNREKWFYNYTWVSVSHVSLAPGDVFYVPAYYHVDMASMDSRQDGTPPGTGSIVAEAFVAGLEESWAEKLGTIVTNFRAAVEDEKARAPSVVIHEILPALFDELRSRPGGTIPWVEMQEHVKRNNQTHDASLAMRELCCRLLVSQYKPVEKNNNEFGGDCPDDPLIEGLDPIDLEGKGLGVTWLADLIQQVASPHWEEPKAAAAIRLAQIAEVLLEEAMRLENEEANRAQKHKVAPFLWSCVCPDEGEEMAPRKLSKDEL